ncbi:MAG TPA: hypothetical protein VJT10_01955 [Steroidobacteraceae bacterium]|nr:hypothetical protein [Steroidobacteraceae bacterium]
MSVSIVKVGRFLTALCALGLLASAASGAEAPATVKHYALELQTLNASQQVRRRGVVFDVNEGMTEDELDAVNKVLDQLGASPVDAEGYRDLSLSNGTQVRIGGFLVEGFLEDSVEGVHSLPAVFSVKDEFSTAEAALVLRIATAGNLFIAGSADADLVATTAQVADRRFYKAHKQAAITADENSLAAWIRQNIPPR